MTDSRNFRLVGCAIIIYISKLKLEAECFFFYTTVGFNN
jgi:hypothetical protein